MQSHNKNSLPKHPVAKGLIAYKTVRHLVSVQVIFIDYNMNVNIVGTVFSLN